MASNPENQATPPAPSKASTVTLRPVDKSNWEAVAKLKTTDVQSPLVASNLFSICESHYDEDEIAKAIYVGDRPAGLIIFSVEEHDDWYGIFRFMVDERYQGIGVGGKALLLAISFIRDTYPKAEFIRLWAVAPEGAKGVPPSDAPFNFYEKYGFKQVNDEKNDDGELEMRFMLKE